MSKKKEMSKKKKEMFDFFSKAIEYGGA